MILCNCLILCDRKQIMVLTVWKQIMTCSISISHIMPKYDRKFPSFPVNLSHAHPLDFLISNCTIPSFITSTCSLLSFIKWLSHANLINTSQEKLYKNWMPFIIKLTPLTLEHTVFLSMKWYFFPSDLVKTFCHCNWDCETWNEGHWNIEKCALNRILSTTLTMVYPNALIHK